MKAKYRSPGLVLAVVLFCNLIQIPSLLQAAQVTDFSRSILLAAVGTPYPPPPPVMNRQPRLTVLQPRPNQRVTAPELTVTGRASDTGIVAAVYYQFNSGPWLVAIGTTNWNLTVDLLAGTNRFGLYALDGAGNLSPTTSFAVDFVVTNRLAASVSPASGGLLMPNLNGRVLEVGRTYRMMAVVSPGYLFSNWVGRAAGQADFTIQGFNPLLAFTMRSNLVLQANMATNPFIALHGSYNGIFLGNPLPETLKAGFFHGDLTRSGSFSGYLRVTNQKYPFSGKAGPQGFTTFTIPGHGSNDFAVELSLPVNNLASDQLTGSVFGTSPLFTADLTAYRAAVYPMGQSSPWAGNYTWLGLDQNFCCSPTNVGGFTYGTVNVSPGGTAVWSFNFGDTATATWTAPMSRDGYCPVFAAPYGNSGVYGGMMNLNPALLSEFKLDLAALAGTNSAASNALSQAQLGLGGESYWARMPSSFPFYPAGFTTELTVFGSKYTRTPFIMPPDNYDMDFRCGDLTTNYSGDFDWGTNRHVTASQPLTWKFGLNLDFTSGRFKGTALLPDTSLHGLSLGYQGVALQGLGGWAGQFKGTNTTGKFFAFPSSWQLSF